MDKCIACGLCAEKCPKKVPDEYDEGLVKRKAAYVQYAQAVPLKYAIDADHCIYLTKGKCRACEKFCPTGAINFDDKAKTIAVNVGAVIIAPGGETYDPGSHDTFGYKKYPNIVTSIEFERILSASGPFGGHLVRPSDKKEPKKIAWLQCIGSRDEHEGGNGYCSSVCCTYAVKEAMLAKEHSANGLDAAIFYIDIRTNGKDFEQYYNRAKDEFNIRFIKSKIISTPPIDGTGRHLITYVDESGKRIDEEFDMVVLSVGLKPTRESAELAEKIGIDLNKYGYAVTNSFEPVCTSRSGIYVCGAFQAPKDIPSSVIDASAGAGMAASKLSSVRWSATKTKAVPEEQDVGGQPPRIGVFVCCCGTNIAGVVDVPAVVEFAKKLPGVVYAEQNMFSCSQDTQDKIAQSIKEQGLNRAVVAACTPKTHEPLFQETLINAGINKYLFEMANIRNQCSWVHRDAPKLATQKAKDMVSMAVAKAKLLKPLKDPIIKVKHAALIIGGGVAGMEAARNLADQGFQCYLIEKSDSLGGQARRLYKTWRGEDVQEYMSGLIEAVSSNENIDIFFNSNVKAAEGFVGNFKTTITQDNGQDSRTHDLEHGVTIIASGAVEFEPNQFLYGKHPNVLTGLDLQQRMVDNNAALAKLNSAVFIQCVGSRIPERPYCSKLCCTQSITSALELKTRNPEMNVFVLYRDMRSYGLREDVYRKARSAGVVFIRFNFEKDLTVEKDETGRLCVTFTDFVLRHQMQLTPDLLVLASPVVPEKENPLAQMYKVSQSEDGFFMEAHVKLRPVDCANDGVFICGLAHAPKPIDESITQAHAAAARAATILAMESIKGEGIVSYIDPELCSGCMGCIEVCPYGAISFDDDKKVAEVNPALCKGCGACAATCPSEAPILMGFNNHQLYAQIDSALSA